MGFMKRAATTGRPEISEGARKETALNFHHEIVSKFEKYQIPHLLILNIDQMFSKLAPTSRHTLVKKNSRHVCIAVSSYKQAITATSGITFSNEFLPMQLIYGGKTQQNFPKSDFSDSFSLSANLKHFSNTEESVKLLDDIIIPYFKCEQSKLGIGEDQYALLILDVLKENHILYVRVPANMTNIFQPLDLTVNGSFRSLMKSKFTKWYSKELGKQLEENKLIEDTEKLKVSVLKPLHASWLIEAYNHKTSSSGREIIVNGWKSAGIMEAVSKGIEGLEKLDPFHSIDPLFQQPNEFLNPSNDDPLKDDLNVEEAEYFATRYDESSSDEWEIEETGEHVSNIFDVFED